MVACTHRKGVYIKGIPADVLQFFTLATIDSIGHIVMITCCDYKPNYILKELVQLGYINDAVEAFGISTLHHWYISQKSLAKGFDCFHQKQ